MKKLMARFVNDIDHNTPVETVSEWIDQFERHAIDITPWPAFQYNPDVSFAMGYCHQYLLIKYYVTEEHVRARYIQINDPVYRDSCVEFFISTDSGNSYYNFEFNCTGNCRAEYGEGNKDRQLLPDTLVRSIRRHAVLKTAAGNGNNIQWELTVLIPFQVFLHHNPGSFKGLSARVNFYKCGDDLPVPHFLAWNNIVSESPDFHRPEFFGKIEFVHPETEIQSFKSTTV